MIVARSALFCILVAGIQLVESLLELAAAYCKAVTGKE
jgi:hypothetical protein